MTNQEMDLAFDDSPCVEYQRFGGPGRKVGATGHQHEMIIRMNNPKFAVEGIKIGLGMALLAVLMGCVGVGYVDGGYGPPVVVPGPDVYFFGGIHERGHDVREYSHRGFESRAVAHPAIRGGRGGRR